MSLDVQKSDASQSAQRAREAGFAVDVDQFGRGTILSSSTSSIEQLLAIHLKLKPMATAPKPKDDEYVQLLVLEEFQEDPHTSQAWRFVYWLDAFDGRPAGWYGNNCGDLRNPLGWVLTTKQLAEAQVIAPKN
jgi:hypothetical protein